jgi:hypothetical protein
LGKEEFCYNKPDEPYNNATEDAPKIVGEVWKPIALKSEVPSKHDWKVLKQSI